MEIIPEFEWYKIVKELKRYKGTTILIGAVDTGKSTFTKYLIKELLTNKVRVSLVDSDIGQSSLGIPGIISMKRFDKPEDFDSFKPDKIFFVGDINPARKISIMVDGTMEMIGIARTEGVKTILVDTTGLIAGNEGMTLKMGKIIAIKPKHILALQEGDELEHILSLIEGICIHRLTVSPYARKRKQKERIEYRSKKYLEYFKGSRTIKLLHRRFEFFYNGKKIDIQEEPIKAGCLIGINRNDKTVALGIFMGLLLDKMFLKSPLKSFKGINRIVVGDIVP